MDHGHAPAKGQRVINNAHDTATDYIVSATKEAFKRYPSVDHADAALVRVRNARMKDNLPQFDRIDCNYTKEVADSKGTKRVYRALRQWGLVRPGLKSNRDCWTASFLIGFARLG